MSEYIQQRNADFMRECRRQKRLAVERGELPTIDEIIARVIMVPAPAYYVSFGYAYRHIAAFNNMAGNGVGEYAGKATRRKMILELAAKSREFMERYPKLTLSDAVARVLADEPASCFFLTRRYGVRLYFRLMAATHRRSRRLRGRKLL